MGLGLAVARGFAEAMGGTLAAEDTPGGGLTMVLTVPAASGLTPVSTDRPGTATSYVRTGRVAPEPKRQ
ncbi:hypothetical protein TN53_41965 [Streptomyces sp. WM6386]|nr:hypothetical protein TN53_41965 [Streptomyces sp. WM6386]